MNHMALISEKSPHEIYIIKSGNYTDAIAAFEKGEGTLVAEDIPTVEEAKEIARVKLREFS